MVLFQISVGGLFDVVLHDGFSSPAERAEPAAEYFEITATHVRLENVQNIEETTLGILNHVN